MRIRVARSIAEVEGLRTCWKSASHQSDATIFQDFDLNVLALRTFADQSPYFIAAESDSSLAIVPWVRRKGILTLAGGRLFDYRDAVCAGDSSAFGAALDATATLGLPISIAGVRDSAASTHWLRLTPQRWTAAPYVSATDVPGEIFAATHNRGRRALRRLIGNGASVRRVAATTDLIDQIYRDKAKESGTGTENVFRDERCIQFMREAVALTNTRCEVFLLEISDRSIATLVTFIDGTVRRFYTTWMDTDWSKQSPGIALLYEATCQTLADRLDCDYMTGEQPYKLRFATGSEPLYKIEASAEQLSKLVRESGEQVELKAA